VYEFIEFRCRLANSSTIDDFDEAQRGMIRTLRTVYIAPAAMLRATAKQPRKIVTEAGMNPGMLSNSRVWSSPAVR
jgi:hypothetical protein